MFKTILKAGFILVLVDISLASICLRRPLCYCNTNARQGMKISCKNVTDVGPINTVLQKYSRIYSLRIYAPEMTTLPSKAFQWRDMYVLAITGPLVNVPADALFGIGSLEIVNFDGGQFTSISMAFSNQRIRTVQLGHGMLSSVEDQLQNNTAMTDALLNDNRISRISPNAFLNVKSLRYLNLSGNLLTELDPALMEPIQQLKSIDLSHNRFFTVDGYFASLNPQGIRLYGNNLTNVDKAFHPEMWSTKWLDLGGNPYLNLSSTTFTGTMPSLTTLSLNENNIEELDPYLLASFRSLYKLCLNGNHLSTIPKYFFSHTPYLNVLELADNDLTSTDDLFPVDEHPHSVKIHTLKTLRLDGNKLTTIHFGSNAKSILRLDLSRNQIQFMTTNDLENLTSVSTLNLSGNPLIEVENGCFKRLPKLQSLDLSFAKLGQLNHSVQNIVHLEELIVDSSSLKVMDKDEFIGSNSLQMISMKDSQLVSVYGAMKNLSNLTSLDISGNNLTTLTLSSLPSNDKRLATLKKLWMADNPWSCDCRLSWILEWLKVKGSKLEDEPTCQSPPHLQGNPIQSLNLTNLETWLDECPRVCSCSCIDDDSERAYTTIDCANQGLVKIPDTFPSNAKEIDLQNNEIISFDAFTPNQTPYLQILNLENNKLQQVKLQSTPSVKVLKLAGNNMSRFQLEEWSTSSFHLVTLSKNPWICDCETWDFRQWLVKNNDSVYDVQEIRCNMDGKLQNKVIIQLDREDLCPNIKNGTKLIVVTALAVALVILCFCCFIFRKTLLILCYSCGCGCLKANERHEYAFDAFLLYSDEVEDFALSVIAEGLESHPPGFSLFIPTRHVFLTNSTVNIESSLTDCCKVIVLLTREFLKNDQCMRLLKASMSCSIQNSSRRMIFITLEHGDLLKELDLILGAVIKNGVYLRCGEFLFWQKLKFYLPKKTSSSKGEESETLVKVGTASFHGENISAGN